MANDGCNSSLGTNENSSFSETLDRLKQRGCSVLVSGLVSDEGINQLSAQLFGDPTVQHDRIRLFGLIGRDVKLVRDRIAGFDADGETTSVITTQDAVRSVSAADSVNDVISLNKTVVSNDVDTFSLALHHTIAEINRTYGRLEPAELRVCIDSLAALLAENDTEQVEMFLDNINQVAIGTRGIIHAVLPSKHDAPVVRRLKPYFDIVVNLRMTEKQVVQQWELPLSGHQTEWFPVERSSPYGF